jgi:uncharacterized protein (DUF2267 family)
VAEFVGHVQERLRGIEPINAEAATRSVLQVLRQNLNDSEVGQVPDMMGKSLRPLWQ